MDPEALDTRVELLAISVGLLADAIDVLADGISPPLDKSKRMLLDNMLIDVREHAFPNRTD